MSSVRWWVGGSEEPWVPRWMRRIRPWGLIGAAIGVLVMFLFIGPKITGALGASEFYRKP